MVSFAHKRKKIRKLNNAVLIAADNLTQNMSLTIGAFFYVKIIRCRSPPKFKFKQKTWIEERKMVEMYLKKQNDVV